MKKPSPSAIVKGTAFAALLGLAAAAALSTARAQEITPGSLGQFEKAFTKPYEERKLQFNQPAVVTEVKVKVGDAVEAGQVIAQQDITIEEAMRIPLEIEAKSTVQEIYAKADQGVKEQEYIRKQELFKTKNASVSEVEEARLAVERAKASVEIAVEERAKANAKIKEIEARIALKTLKSPVSGFVQAIDTGVGEVGGIDQQKPSFVIVQNDPLKVEADIPIRDANRLQVGQTLQVRYVDEDNAPWQPAKILAMLPVAERGSQTRNIVLEVSNPKNKPAGLWLDLRLVGGGAAANAGQQ